MDLEQKKQQCGVWAKKVESACEEDKWGHVLDASDQYQQVLKSIANSVHIREDGQLGDNNNEGEIKWTGQETEFLQNVAMCLKQRVDVLIQSPISKDKQFSRDKVAEVIPPLRNFSLRLPNSPTNQNNTSEGDPEQASNSRQRQRKQSQQMLAKWKEGRVVELDASAEHLENNLASSRKESLVDSTLKKKKGVEDDDGPLSVDPYEMTVNTVVAVSKPGNLLQLPKKKPGETLLSVSILKVGLKDAHKTLETFWTVSVKDTEGKDVTEIQETPSCGVTEQNYITFDTVVHIQKPLESLPEKWAIFFELKHYRVEKNACGVKCWAMLESDEVKNHEGKKGTHKQDVILELYKKPTDFKRKKMSLLTKKELYLHLQLTTVA